jgi:hypothetical protein
MLALVSEVLARVESEHLLKSAISFQVWPIVEIGRAWMELRGGARLHAHLLTHHLRGASHLAIGVCTLGSPLEDAVSRGFASGDRLRAIMLDDIGTLLLYRLSDQLEHLMQVEARSQGLEASGVLNPGEAGFDLSEQATVVELAGGADIGVALTSTGMLLPRKSLSMVLGFGLQMPKWDPGERCARCGARDRCPHRRQTLVEVTK